MAFLDVSESTAAWIYAASSIAVIVFGILAYWSSGKLSAFTDTKLADARATAGKANEAAGKANERAADANERAAALEKLAADAQKGLAVANLEIEKRRGENLAIARELETEKKERIRLLAAAGPRIIEQDKSMHVLGRLAPVKVIFECPEEFECEHLAEQIASLTGRARWDFTPVLRDPVVRGSISVRHSTWGEDVLIEGQEPHATQLSRQISGRSLVKAVTQDPAVKSDVPPNTIRVKIFPKQGQYFIDELSRLAAPPEYQHLFELTRTRKAKEVALTPDEQPTESELKEWGGATSTFRLILRREGTAEEKLFREAMERNKKETAARKKADSKKPKRAP